MWKVSRLNAFIQNNQMKVIRYNQNTSTVPQCVEFYDERLDKHFRIENYAASVVIRTGGPALSSSEQEFLVRHLSAEGFIPDRYRWYLAGDIDDGAFSVQWLEDSSWIRPGQNLTRLKARFARPFIATSGMLLLVALILMGQHLAPAIAMR